MQVGLLCRALKGPPKCTTNNVVKLIRLTAIQICPGPVAQSARRCTGDSRPSLWAFDNVPHIICVSVTCDGLPRLLRTSSYYVLAPWPRDGAAWRLCLKSMITYAQCHLREVHPQFDTTGGRGRALLSCLLSTSGLASAISTPAQAHTQGKAVLDDSSWPILHYHHGPLMIQGEPSWHLDVLRCAKYAAFPVMTVMLVAKPLTTAATTAAAATAGSGLE